MVVLFTTAFPSVPHVPSAFCPGMTGLHPLCIRVSVMRCSPVLVTQLSISVPEPGRKHNGCPYHIDGTIEHAISAPVSRLASVPEPDASRVGPTLLCYTAVVLQAQGAYPGPAASFACLGSSRANANGSFGSEEEAAHSW